MSSLFTRIPVKTRLALEKYRGLLFSQEEEDLLALQMRAVSSILLVMPEVYLISVTIKLCYNVIWTGEEESE